MIEPKKAVEEAVKYLKDVMQLPDTTRINLEELVLSSDNKNWVVTIAYDSTNLPENSLSVLLNGRMQERRRIEVDGTSGNVVALRK
ncbi:hypothetical protein FWH09_01485 [Candidatus Saccharibacteria bacterium]|nr:hypothetical protein [Candidatus Saccharibacteria bacterium]